VKATFIGLFGIGLCGLRLFYSANTPTKKNGNLLAQVPGCSQTEYREPATTYWARALFCRHPDSKVRSERNFCKSRKKSL